MVNELSEAIVKLKKGVDSAQAGTAKRGDNVDKFQLIFEFQTLTDSESTTLNVFETKEETLNPTDSMSFNASLNTFTEGGQDRWDYGRWDYARYAGLGISDSVTVALEWVKTTQADWEGMVMNYSGAFDLTSSPGDAKVWA